MSATWYKIRCELPEKCADDAAEALAEYTGSGVCTANLEVDTFSADTITEPEIRIVEAYISSDRYSSETLNDIINILNNSAAGKGLSIPTPVVSTVDEEDWANSWKAGFKPCRIGNRIVIKPTWEEYLPQQDDILLEIDPGRAFGTGTHETTRLCIIELERYLAESNRAVKVLDVGTGSGILAIASILLGASNAEGIDIDPVAVDVSYENAKLNNVENKISFSTLPLTEISRTFDITVANILAEELVKMRKSLEKTLSPCGLLILSGILAEKEKLVLDGFSDTSLKHVRTEFLGEWCAIIFEAK